MDIIKKLAILIIICCLFVIPAGCAAEVPETNDNPEPVAADGVIIHTPKQTVSLVITSNFGKELILEKEIIPGSDATAMTVLQDAVDVETKYGGGFVAAINGISSEFGGSDGKQKDWLYFMNGLSFNIGAVDYKVNAGDTEHWDFRDWSYYQMTPAIIGDFPQPFLNGSKGKVYPTTIVYESEFQNEADSLVETFKQAGVSDITAIDIEQLTDQVKSHNNLILLTDTNNSLIQELSQAQKKLGLYAFVENGDFILIDASGNRSQALNTDCCVIQATQNPWNPGGSAAGENVLWTITGTSEHAVNNAVTVLGTRFAEIKHSFAVAITETDILKIP